MWAKDSPNITTIALSLILFDGFDGQFFGERTRIFKARAEMGGDYPQMEEAPVTYRGESPVYFRYFPGPPE